MMELGNHLTIISNNSHKKYERVLKLAGESRIRNGILTCSHKYLLGERLGGSAG